MRLADLYNLDPNGGKGSGNLRFMCPFDCASKAKPANAANRDLSVNKRTGAYHCFACAAKGLLDDFKTEAPKQSRKEYTLAKVRRAVGSIPQPKPQEETPESGEWKSRLAGHSRIDGEAATAGANYLAGRGISVEVARVSGVRFGRYAHKDEEFSAVIFPIKNTDGELVGFNARAIVGKLNRHGGNVGAGVFSARCSDYAAIEGVVIITEAPIDALSLATCGYPAFALGGTPYRDLLDVIHPRATAWLGYDADTAGSEACEKWAAELKHCGRISKRLSPPDSFKDWNEALTKMGREALQAFLQERIAPLVREDTPQEDTDLFENDAELIAWMNPEEAPEQEQAGTTQGVSPENWEIMQGLLFSGGECAARLLVALCRLSDNLPEIEARLREGETLGLWKRTERTDVLGFPIWAYNYEPDVHKYPIQATDEGGGFA